IFGKTVNGTMVPTAVDPTTLSPSDIVLKDPSGNVVTIQQVNPVDNSVFDPTYVHNIYNLVFNTAVSGNYTITIGPNVTDFSGDKMLTFNGRIAINPLTRPMVSLPYSDAFGGNFGDPLPRQWLNGPGYFNIQTSPTSAAPVIPLQNFALAKAAGTNIAVLQM